MSRMKRTCIFLIVIAVFLTLFTFPVHADNKFEPYGSWDDWTDIRKLDYSYNGNVLFGVKNDGTVLGCLLSEEDSSLHEELQEVLSWTDIDSLYVKGDAIIGLKNDGTVLLNSYAAQECTYDADRLTNVKAILGDYNHFYFLHNDGTVSGFCLYYTDEITTGFEGVENIKYLYTSYWGSMVAVTEDGKIVWPKSSNSDYDLQNSITENWEDIEKVFRADNIITNLVVARKSDGTTSCRSYGYNGYDLSRMPFLEKVVEGWQNIKDQWSEWYQEDFNVLLDDGTLKGVGIISDCEIDETEGTLSGCEKFNIVDYRKLNLANVHDGDIILDSGEIYPYSKGEYCGYREKYKYNGESGITEVITPWGNELGLTENGTVVKIDSVWNQNLWNFDSDGEKTDHVISEDLTGKKPGEPGQLWCNIKNYQFAFQDGGPYISESGFTYDLLEDEGAAIIGYEGEETEDSLRIPYEIDGQPVIYISGIDCGQYHILIPDTVTAVNLIFESDSSARVAIPSSVKGYEGHYNGCKFPEIGYYNLDCPNKDVPEFFEYGKGSGVQLPKEESYLPVFEKMTVKTSSANVYDYKSSGKQIQKGSLPYGAEVYALARQSIMTFVLYKDEEQQVCGGWITSENLAFTEESDNLHGLFSSDTAA
ncbi:MAG: hypothetical protein Q4F31_06490 [Eubacteriales bacterium]|nr:hypothetical protein [Eubacteriales bacterium]